MPESTHHLNQRARKGIRTLLLRQGVLLVLTFAGGVILARVLNPADFGVFGITTFIVNLLALFGDCGLAPSFIQRKQALTDRDLQVGFTLQQALVTLVVVVLLTAAPWLASLYPSSAGELVWLIRALAFNLYLQTWRSMSALQLERRIAYRRLAAVEVVEQLSYQIVAVVMALLGFGVWSLVGAVLTRGVLGSLLVYVAAPWPVRFGFDREIAAGILRYGIPFQFQRIVGNAKGWVTPTLVAWLIGADAVGFLMWGSSNGRKPMQLFDNVIRVSFPHFSRMQDKQGEVERILSHYHVAFLATAGAWFSVLAVAGYDLTLWIYTAKWLPAVPVLILYAFLLHLTSVSRSTKIAISGMGRIRFTTKVTIVATVLHLALAVGLVVAIEKLGGPGFIGVPIAHLLSLAVTLPWLFSGLRPGALARVLGPAAWVCVPIGAAIATGLLLRWVIPPLPLAVQGPGLALVTAFVYAATAWSLGPEWLRDKARESVAQLRGRFSPQREPALP